jgi:hypothetical protein
MDTIGVSVVSEARTGDGLRFTIKYTPEVKVGRYAWVPEYRQTFLIQRVIFKERRLIEIFCTEEG